MSRSPSHRDRLNSAAGARVSPALLRRLCAWFDANARDLPWRRKRNAYTALVAETMLQQTQVSRVTEYFQRFILAFPTVSSLAAADPQRVLALWQGLGYYRRALNLHGAAKMIVRDFGGRVPRRADDLVRLPGVGRYTAGAIASIACGESAAIVDGNVERVLLRIFADGADADRRRSISAAQQRARAWQLAEVAVSAAPQPGVLNEALMELGATVCLPQPSVPRCAECPVARRCGARKLGIVDHVPPTKTRRAPHVVHHHAVMIVQAGTGKCLLERRAGGGMWAGMWQAPTIESDGRIAPRTIRSALPVRVGRLRKCGEFDHRTTHRAIRFAVYRAQTASRVRGRGLVWRATDNLGDLPMSIAQQRVIEIALGASGARQAASASA